MRILVTGANGQLGSALQRLAPAFGHAFDFRDRATLDLCDGAAVRDHLARTRPEAIINCAAYTAVDKAESDVDAARAVNVDAVAVLAKAAEAVGAHLVHVSTDYVYHNGLDRPLREDDPTTPQGVYAATKLEGERAALEACAKTTIVRTSWVYGLEGHNFVRTMARLGAERERLTVVSDQIGAPTFADDLARACLRAIDLGDASHGETVNYAGEGVASWYDFARAIMRTYGRACEVAPIPSADYPTPAARPTYSVLDLGKARRLGLGTRHWRDALADFARLDATRA